MTFRKRTQQHVAAVRRLAKEGRSSREIGIELNIHPVTIWRWASMLGVRLPTPTEVRERNRRASA